MRIVITVTSGADQPRVITVDDEGSRAESGTEAVDTGPASPTAVQNVQPTAGAVDIRTLPAGAPPAFRPDPAAAPTVLGAAPDDLSAGPAANAAEMLTDIAPPRTADGTP